MCKDPKWNKKQRNKEARVRQKERILTRPEIWKVERPYKERQVIRSKESTRVAGSDYMGER